MNERPGLFAVARDKMRTRHFAYRTEQAYLHWIRRYVAFNDRRHPRELGAEEVERFLTDLAVARKVSASTQNQALQALLFLYRHVLGVDLPWLSNVTRARRPARLPVVLTRREVRALLAELTGTPCLVANLLYGSGLRLLEALRLRVKDLMLDRGELIVRDPKGGRDRVTVLPAALAPPLRAHLSSLHAWFLRERRRGEPGVSVPEALARKYPGAGLQWGWQYVFPSQSLCKDPYSGTPVRHHQHEKIDSAGGTGGGRACGARPAGELPYLSSLLRDALARGRLRHPHRAGAIGSRGCPDDDDLHPCPRRGREGG